MATPDLERRSYYAPLAADLREEGAPRVLSGHAAVFGVEVDLGWFRERIEPGAFARTIAEDDVRMVWNHNTDYPLARNRAGTLQLREDARGLYIEAVLPDTTYAQDAWAVIRRGDVSQMSFAFTIPDGGERWEDLDTPKPLRILTAIDLWEVSPVTFPAYQSTDISARAIERARSKADDSRRDIVVEGKREQQKKEKEKMGKTLDELRAEHERAIARMDELLAKADEEARDLSDEEEREFDQLDQSVHVLRRQIGRRERLERVAAAQKEKSRLPMKAAMYRAPSDEEFRSLGEFLHAVVYRQDDRRLRDLYTEARGQSMDVGAGGGFAVPTQFVSQLLMADPQAAIFRPRATVIPAGSPPDAELSIPALDQAPARGMYGGVSVSWIGEGETKPETSAYLRLVALKPHEVAGYITVTDKLLRNWEAASATLERLMRGAITAAEEDAFFSGDGAGKPVGIVDAPASIAYSRAAANSIAYEDIVGMYARAKQGGAPVWIASPTCIPQLATIKGGANENLWVQNAAAGVPPTLLGLPVIFRDASPALGTKGDLVLADLSYYLIKDGSGPFVAASEHVHFTSNKTVIKVFWNVDGKPWLNTPFGIGGGSTVSPFVILS